MKCPWLVVKYKRHIKGKTARPLYIYPPEGKAGEQGVPCDGTLKVNLKLSDEFGSFPQIEVSWACSACGGSPSVSQRQWLPTSVQEIERIVSGVVDGLDFKEEQ